MSIATLPNFGQRITAKRRSPACPVIIRWRYGDPNPTNKWCYAGLMPYPNGEMGWGAMIDEPGRAIVFPNAFRAMRWMLARHNWPKQYMECFRDGSWQIVPHGGDLPLFAEAEVTA